MNGNNRFLLDTNAIVALLNGHRDMAQQLSKAEWVGISIISQLEFLVFPKLPEVDQAYFNQFLQRVEVIGLDTRQQALITTIIHLRRKRRLKLPDAIIAGTAIQYNATLITADKQLHKIDEVAVLDVS